MHALNRPRQKVERKKTSTETSKSNPLPDWMRQRTGMKMKKGKNNGKCVIWCAVGPTRMCADALCLFACTTALTNINNFLVCDFPPYPFPVVARIRRQPTSHGWYTNRLVNCSNFYGWMCSLRVAGQVEQELHLLFYLWKWEWDHIKHSPWSHDRLTCHAFTLAVVHFGGRQKIAQNVKPKYVHEFVALFLCGIQCWRLCAPFCVFCVRCRLDINVYQFYAKFSHSIEKNVDRYLRQRLLSLNT